LHEHAATASRQRPRFASPLSPLRPVLLLESPAALRARKRPWAPLIRMDEAVKAKVEKLFNTAK
jgi:hypothetical protein